MGKFTIKDVLKEKLDKEIISSINRSFEVVGDIAIFEISDEFDKYSQIIADAIMKTNSSIKTVLKKSGVHHGEFRTQDLVYVAGENKKETIYTENQIRLYVNPQEVYFSARLSTERAELMDELGDKKRVLVMFSGSGPYSYVGYRKNPNIQRITSVEINPVGDSLAKKSLGLNKNIAKKTLLYKELVEFLKLKDIRVVDKILICNINNLKLQFFNADVRKKVEDFKLVCSNSINYYHNELFKQDFNDLVDFFKSSEIEEINIDLDDEKLDRNVIKYILIMFLNNFKFKCKIKDEFYLFESYLQKNYLLNFLEGFDIEKVEMYDEIFMPLPKDAELFLDCVFRVGDKNSIVHMYDFVHENEFPHKSENAVVEAAKKNGCDIEIIQTRKVGQYSPRKYRVCCDFIIR